MKQEVRLPQGTVRYRDEGTGETLLFFHGIVVNSELWRKIIPRLSPNFRCIAPDWPLGSHLPPMEPHADLSLWGLRQLAVDFMDELGLERATLVGTDGGGAIAQMLAVHHPERVDRLVLASSELYHLFVPPVFKPLVKAARIPGSLGLLAQLFRSRRLLRAPFAYGWSIKSGLPDQMTLDAYLKPGRESAGVRRDMYKYLQAVDPQYTIDLAEGLKSFEKPVLLAWAKDDKLFPLVYPQRLASELPDARLEVIPDSYTFVSEDQPELLSRAISSFMQEKPRSV